MSDKYTVRTRRDGTEVARLPIDLPVELLQRLDEKRGGSTRTAAVLDALQTYLDAKDDDVFTVHIVHLPSDVAFSLAAYRFAADEPPAPNVMCSAVREYVDAQVRENPGIRRRYDVELAKLRRKPHVISELADTSK